MLSEEMKEFIAKVEHLYEKENSRILTESRLIEEIVRLEKLEDKFLSMIDYIKREHRDISRIYQEIDCIADKKISEAAASIHAKAIISKIAEQINFLSEEM